MIEWLIAFWFVFPLAIIILGLSVAAIWPDED